jgi:hypothetical protein
MYFTPMLQDSVVDEGERLAGFDRREEHQPAEKTRLAAIFLERGRAVVFAALGDVRLHAYCEIAAGGSAFHRAPHVRLAGLLRRNADVDAWPAHCVARSEAAVRILERPDGRIHREHFRHVVVVDEEHAAKDTSRKKTSTRRISGTKR